MVECGHANIDMTLSDQIRCKDCGALLDSVEKKVGNATSVIGAKRLQEEMAVMGKYTASAFSDGFVVYSRIRNNIREEVLCRKAGVRMYHILKRLSVAT